MTSGIIEELLTKKILPSWTTAVEQARNFIESAWVTDLDKDLARRMKNELQADYAELFKLRPDLHEIWHWQD